MRVLFEIDKKDCDENAPEFHRPSVRGIIRENGRLALVYSIKYDYYKFPGGGVDKDESHTETLKRELLEEIGKSPVLSSIKEYGYVHRIEKGREDNKFIQDNYYYFCDVSENTVNQNLDEYEKDEGFTLSYVEPQKAIETNINHEHAGADDFTKTIMQREAKVISLLLEEKLI